MSIIKKFLLASRYDKPHGILLLYFPCVWGINLNDINTSNDIFLYFIFLIGACGMRALGCLWNDFNDKDFDIQVKRTKSRLIASKKITNKTIVIFFFYKWLYRLSTIILYSNKFNYNFFKHITSYNYLSFYEEIYLVATAMVRYMF